MNNKLAGLIAEICAGNLGAIHASCELVNYVEEPDAAMVMLLALRDLKLTGPEIWTLYKDECEYDIQKFGRAVIEKRADCLMEAQADAR